jgi:hypothetical protein
MLSDHLELCPFSGHLEKPAESGEREVSQPKADPQNALPLKGGQKPGDQQLKNSSLSLTGLSKSMVALKSAGQLCGGSGLRFDFISAHRETFTI